MTPPAYNVELLSRPYLYRASLILPTDRKLVAAPRMLPFVLGLAVAMALGVEDLVRQLFARPRRRLEASVACRPLLLRLVGLPGPSALKRPLPRRLLSTSCPCHRLKVVA